jgi:hypothetical protein
MAYGTRIVGQAILYQFHDVFYFSPREKKEWKEELVELASVEEFASDGQRKSISSIQL